MLINAYKNPPRCIPGTRMLEDTLGTMGVRIPDPQTENRTWEVQSMYLPIEGRMLGGVRAKLVDQKNFVTFCNQRDLEVMLGLGIPGRYCVWAGAEYVGPDHAEWFGFCADDDDLLDDLFDREMFLRGEYPGGVLPPGLCIERGVHTGETHDFEDVFILRGDVDFDTGMYPDLRMETLERRWARSERRRVRWERL